jgi:hypothetical protein
MKLTLQKRQALWDAEMHEWEYRTENYRDYGLSKALQLDKKYKMDKLGAVSIERGTKSSGLVGIKKSWRSKLAKKRKSLKKKKESVKK